MTSLIIRNIDDRLKVRLRLRETQQGRSMEGEARSILQAALSAETAWAATLVDAVRARIEPLGGLEVGIVPREPIRLTR